MLRQFKQKLKSVSLSPFADGRFEIYLNGKRIYSKLETKEFPAEDAILEALAKG